jgi:hypothetical protein
VEKAATLLNISGRKIRGLIGRLPACLCYLLAPLAMNTGAVLAGQAYWLLGTFGGLLASTALALVAPPRSRLRFHALQAVSICAIGSLLTALTLLTVWGEVFRGAERAGPSASPALAGMAIIVVFSIVYGGAIVLLASLLYFLVRTAFGRDPRLFVVGPLLARLTGYPPPAEETAPAKPGS